MAGDILDVSQKALSLFKCDEQTMLSLRVQDLHPENAHGISLEAFRRIQEDGQVNFEVDFRNQVGEVFSTEVFSSRIEVGNRRIVQGVVRNIPPSQREAEEAPRQ